MTSHITFYKQSGAMTDTEIKEVDRAVVGYVNADYSVRDRLLEDGTLQLIDLETEDEDEVIAIFENSGWQVWPPEVA